MRIGILAPPYKESVGGGFTYINAILSHIEARDSDWEYVVIDYNDILQRTAISCAQRDIAAWDERHRPSSRAKPFWQRFSSLLSGGSSRDEEARASQPNLPQNVDDVLNEALALNGVDLLWLIAPFAVVKPRIPYVVTVWDLAHRVFPFFPEVSEVGWKWDEREHYYREMLPKASWIITGNSRGAEEVSVSYGVLKDRIRSIPLPSIPIPADETYPTPTERDYIFYPANFWPHKNHVRLLEAFRILTEDLGHDIDLVLTGSDQGNEAYITSLCSEDLRKRVHLLGFVPRGGIGRLLRSAKALAYVSFFGPDNLPPLEAFAGEIPVVASDHAGHREQLGSAALLADPLNARDIAMALHKVLTDTELRARLCADGKVISDSRSIAHYVEGLEAIWSEFAAYRACWPPRDPERFTSSR